MLSGTLYRVALVRSDVSEKVSSPYSVFLRVIGFHNCFTVESLLTSLSIEGYYLWMIFDYWRHNVGIRFLEYGPDIWNQ
jgi:hypothetical protein